MTTTQHAEEESKLALQWFEINDIVAWLDTDEKSIYVEINKDTNVLIGDAEISYRAELYKEHYEN
jgi:hypothetical protein